MGAEDYIPEDQRPELVEASPAPSGHEAKPAPPKANARRALLFGLLLLPAVLLLWFGGMETVTRGARALAFPYQLDREEGFLLDQANRLARGETIYPALDDYPYVVGNYPPLYPMMFAAAVGLTSPMLPMGRAIAMLSVLVILAALANATLRAGPGVAPAFLAMGLFLAGWEVHEWIAYARVDFPALAFGLAGFVAATVSRRWPWLVLASLLFVIAFFTKQTQVVAPAAVALALLLRGDVARAGVLCVLVGAGIGGGIAGLSAATDGEFWRHTVVYNANEFVPGQIGVWLKHLWLFGKWKLAAGALLLCLLPLLVRLRRAEDESEDRPQGLLIACACYVLLAGLSLGATGKAGAAGNYLIEFQAALALLLGVGCARMQAMLAEGRRRAALVWTLGGAVAAILAIHGGWYVLRGRQLLSPPPANAEQIRLAERIIHETVLLRVVETEGPILTEYPVFAIYAGREVLYQPFIMGQLAREGKWDPAPFVEDLREGMFRLIITRTDFRQDTWNPDFTDEMIEALRENYRLDDRIGEFYLFVPSEVPVEPGNRVRLIRTMV